MVSDNRCAPRNLAEYGYIGAWSRTRGPQAGLIIELVGVSTITMRLGVLSFGQKHFPAGRVIGSSTISARKWAINLN